MVDAASPLAGKVVWLTGASSGLGRACAQELAGTGCRLALSARRSQELQALAAELGAPGRQVAAFACDVTDKAAVKARHAEIEQRLGPVDVLIANAGSHIPTVVEKFDTEEYRALMELNYFGALHCIEAVIGAMIERKEGHIVAVSSVAGYRALPHAAAYGASKAALAHFSESIRFNLARHGIFVTVVSPGFVRTPLTAKNEFPMPCLMEPGPAARELVRGIERKEYEIHFPKRFTFAMKLLRVIPFPLYRRAIAKFVLKQ